MALRTVLDKAFCLYYFTQLLSTTFLETQSVVPARFYPRILVDMQNKYLRDFRDPYLADVDAVPWYKVFCLFEYMIFIPHYFLAFYAYARGVRKCPWIRLPCFGYCVWLLTVTCSISMAVMTQDFGGFKVPVPRNFDERLKLAKMYLSFAVCALIMLVDTWIGSGYTSEEGKAEEDKKND